MKATDIPQTKHTKPPARTSPSQEAMGDVAPKSLPGATGTLDPPGTPTAQAFPDLEPSLHIPGLSTAKRTDKPRLPMASEDTKQISIPSLPPKTVSPADYGGVITEGPSQPTIKGTGKLNSNIAQLREKYGY